MYVLRAFFMFSLQIGVTIFLKLLRQLTPLQNKTPQVLTLGPFSGKGQFCQGIIKEVRFKKMPQKELLQETRNLR